MVIDIAELLRSSSGGGTYGLPSSRRPCPCRREVELPPGLCDGMHRRSGSSPLTHHASEASRPARRPRSRTQARPWGRLLACDEHVHQSVLQRLERPMATRVLSGLHVFERCVVSVFERAHGFRAGERSRIVDAVLDQRQSPAVRTDSRLIGNHHVIEPDIGRAQLVDRAVRPQRHTGRARLDDEYADALCVMRLPRRAETSRRSAPVLSTTRLSPSMR